MSRGPNMIPYREWTRLEDVLADIREYAKDNTLPHRDILLPYAAGSVLPVAKDLHHSPVDVKSLLETVVVVRDSSGPGKSSAEETLMNQLHMIGWSCASCLKASGVRSGPHGTLKSSDPAMQHFCDVVVLLVDFARECFAYSQPRDSFGGKRRSLAFEILETVVDIIDLPEFVEQARQTVKKNRPDALGATTFLTAYFRARKAAPDADLQDSLLKCAKRSKRRGQAAGALNVLVETGAISDMEACDRMY